MAISHLDAVSRALEALDAEELVAHYSEPFTFEDAAAGITIIDLAQLQAYFESLFSMPDVAFTEVVMFEDGDGRGAGEWVWSGSDGASGLFHVKGASLFLLDEGGIVRETIYYRPPNIFGSPGA